MEEAHLTQNYFRTAQWPASSKPQSRFSEHYRSAGIQKIFYLHQKKDYKEETLFVAAAIFDRYINIIGVTKFPKEKTVHLATIATLMSAKLEQPISPSFTRMINLLSTDEKKIVTKESLIELESDIIIKLGFDFNFQGPMQTLERYLRLLNYDMNDVVSNLGFEICKYQLNEASSLDFRPSQISACAVIISVNIFKRDKNETDFFKPSDKDPKLFMLNTDIWNNEEMTNTTGYSITDLRACLYSLAKFMAENLVPNRLANFDLESIKSIEPYHQIPLNLHKNINL